MTLREEFGDRPILTFFLNLADLQPREKNRGNHELRKASFKSKHNN